MIPFLRFKQFSGNWTVKTFQGAGIKVIDGDRGNNYPSKVDFGKSGFCLFLSVKNVTKEGFRFQEKSFITKERDELLRKGKLKRDDIVLTTRGTVGNIAYFDDSVLFEEIRINSGMVVLRNESNILDQSFFYTSFYSPNLVKQINRILFGSAQPQLTVKEINKFKIRYGKPKEQQKIADFLSAVDKKIRLLKQKHSLLQQYKKGVMQQLFSQQIRFKDDNGKAFSDWRVVRLKDILVLQSRPIDMLDDVTYELITVKRRNEGIVSRGMFKGKDVLVKNQFQLKEGQFVISKRQIVHGACGMVPGFLEGATLSNEYNVFEANRKLLDIQYFNLFATTLEMRKAFFRNSDGVHIEKLLFKTQSWLKTKLQLPCVDEQLKILEFVKTLDKKIELTVKQIELSQTFKKGLLQQMFV